MDAPQPARDDGLWTRRLGRHVGDELFDKALRLRLRSGHGGLRGDHNLDGLFQLGVREREPESVDHFFRVNALREARFDGERSWHTGDLRGQHPEAIVEDDGAATKVAGRAMQMDRELKESRYYGKVDRFGHGVLSKDDTASGTDGRKAPRMRFRTFIFFDIGPLQRN